jgi:hypothetical protein
MRDASSTEHSLFKHTSRELHALHVVAAVHGPAIVFCRIDKRVCQPKGLWAWVRTYVGLYSKGTPPFAPFHPAPQVPSLWLLVLRFWY